MQAVRKNRYVVTQKDFDKAYKIVIKKSDKEFGFYKWYISIYMIKKILIKKKYQNKFSYMIISYKKNKFLFEKSLIKKLILDIKINVDPW